MHAHDINDMDVYRRRYDYTAYLSRRDWAWEYLRRNMTFERDAYHYQDGAVSIKDTSIDMALLKMRRPQLEAAKWGLIMFPDPAQHAPKAPVFWSDDACKSKVLLTVTTRAPRQIDTILEAMARKCRISHLTDWKNNEHLVVSGVGCSILARCNGLPLLSSDPVIMSFSVASLPERTWYWGVLERSARVFSDYSQRPVQFTRQARFLRNGLIALDGRRAGFTDRQVAEILFGEQDVSHGLQRADHSLVRRVKSYRDKARALSDGGYRNLLDPEITR